LGTEKGIKRRSQGRTLEKRGTGGGELGHRERWRRVKVLSKTASKRVSLKAVGTRTLAGEPTNQTAKKRACQNLRVVAETERGLGSTEKRMKKTRKRNSEVGKEKRTFIPKKTQGMEEPGTGGR